MFILQRLRAKYLALYVLRLVTMPSAFTRHPAKGVYFASFLTSLPLRLLFSLIYYLPSKLRPHPEWSVQQSVGTFALKALFSMWTKIEYHPTKTLEPGSDGERFISISPGKPSIYTGVVSHPHVKPAAIAGMWYPKVFSPTNNSKVVLYFHGGAYVLGGCRPLEGGHGPETIAKAYGSVALALQYRLAWQFNGHFPAPLQDAITGYAHLLSLGIKGENIILAGESAGGNLALILLRYLTEHPASGLPLPGGVCGFSPWVDLSMTGDDMRMSPHLSTDWIPPTLPAYGAKMYIPPGMRASDPYFSPLSNEFATDVPIFVQTCDLELLYESHIAYAENLRKKGIRIGVHVIKNGCHDSFGAAPPLGLIKEADEAAAAAVKFLEG